MGNLLDVVDAFGDFVNKHAGEPLNPSTFLTQEQLGTLTTLDAQLYAHCHVSGLSLSGIPDPKEPSFGSFGNSKLPYMWCTIHVPIKDGAGKVTGETVASGMMILPTAEWVHALRSLRAAAQLLDAESKNGHRAQTSKSESPEKGTSQDKTSKESHNHSAREKRNRGRPTGSETQMSDRKLYEDWKAAHRETGMSKKEFLCARGLPECDVKAIERGRKHKDSKQGPGK
jgi:hypothetical protein